MVPSVIFPFFKAGLKMNTSSTADLNHRRVETGTDDSIVSIFPGLP